MNRNITRIVAIAATLAMGTSLAACDVPMAPIPARATCIS